MTRSPGGPPAADGGACDEGGRGQRRPTAEQPDRMTSGPCGHSADPTQAEARRQVEQPVERGPDDAGEEPPGQPPDHQRSGHRGGQQVGGQGRDRHGAEEQQQEGCNGRLGGEGHRRRLPEGPRPRQQVGEGCGSEDDAGAGGHRQLEGRPVDEQRIDENQADDGEAEQPQPVGLPTPGSDQGTAPGHHCRPENRWLEPGDQGEEAEEQEGGRKTRPEPEPAKQRAGGCDDERHVLARDGEEVAQASGPEVVGGPVVLGAVVPEDEAGQERGLFGWQRSRAVDEGPPQGVRQAVERTGRPNTPDSAHLEGAFHVADPLPAPWIAVEVPGHLNPLPRQQLADPGRRRRELGVVTAPVEADLGTPSATGKRTRIRDQPRDARHRPLTGVGGPLPRTVRQGTGNQEQPEHGDEDRAPAEDAPGRRAGGRQEEDRRIGGMRQERAGEHPGDQQQRSHPVGLTWTCSRRPANLAGPMPETMRRSSIEANGPKR